MSGWGSTRIAFQGVLTRRWNHLKGLCALKQPLACKIDWTVRSKVPQGFFLCTMPLLLHHLFGFCFIVSVSAEGRARFAASASPLQPHAKSDGLLDLILLDIGASCPAERILKQLDVKDARHAQEVVSVERVLRRRCLPLSLSLSGLRFGSFSCIPARCQLAVCLLLRVGERL